MPTHPNPARRPRIGRSPSMVRTEKTKRTHSCPQPARSKPLAGCRPNRFLPLAVPCGATEKDPSPPAFLSPLGPINPAAPPAPRLAGPLHTSIFRPANKNTDRTHFRRQHTHPKPLTYRRTNPLGPRSPAFSVPLRLGASGVPSIPLL